MREKFLPRRLAFLIIVRGRGQREILKNPRPAGSWQPFKSIFGERKKDRPQRAGSPALSVLCAKEPDRGSLRQLQSKFLPRCQNPQFCGFAPRGKLVGECLPQTLLMRPYGRESLQIKSQAPNGTCCKEIWQKVGRKKCSTNKPPQSAGLKREKRK